MYKSLITIFLLLWSSYFFAKPFANKNDEAPSNLQKAEQTLAKIYALYSIDQTMLLAENYPTDPQYSATYVATESQEVNKYSYLWPFSGTLSAVTALYIHNKDTSHLATLENKVLPALKAYSDYERKPFCYQSYIADQGFSDRFYDDNIWIGLDFVDLYLHTNNKKYLDEAIDMWRFIESGTDNKLGGGVYWCEQKKFSKNTCSNAPAAVLAIKLYEATKDKDYLKQGLAIYNWTQKNLQDPDDKLYYDNLSLEGKLDKTKYAYNTGQMMQAAALLYKCTKKKEYLQEAQILGDAAMKYFTAPHTPESGKAFPLIKKGNIWFTAILFRGYTELFQIDKNMTNISIFDKNLNYIWNHGRDENGLFQTDWSGKEKQSTKWLLTQAALVEMYAAMGKIKD
ncbi:alpha-1,6-mannanase [Bacteroidales bacterium]|nr:alpha-1,6-mannanase [Bacteroidales bacterium]